MKKIIERIDSITNLIQEKLSQEADELSIFIDNDRQLYNSRLIPIYKNLSKKMKKGQYKRNLAAKAFMHLIDEGAKKYVKEHGSPGDKWNVMFPKKDRMELAEAYAKEFEEKFKNKEYDFMEGYREEINTENTINDLRDIVDKKRFKKIRLQDGKTVNVDLFTARSMLNTRDSMKKPESVEKFDEMVGSLHGFLKLADFASKHAR